MSQERIDQIGYELIQLFIAFKENLDKVLLLTRELQDLGVRIPPETQQMLLRMTKMGQP